MFMEKLRNILLLCPLLFSIIFARHDCSHSNSAIGFDIRFPFRLENQPQRCGYPGFTLKFNDQKNPILNLPYSGDFLVRDIDYLSQDISLYDPNDCLPRRLLSLNLASSPFMGTFYQNYTFLRCPPESNRPKFSALIDCLSNSTVSIIATSLRLALAMNMCRIIDSLPIPFPNPPQDVEGLSASLKGDLMLAWNLPSCENCEARGGTCGYANTTTQEASCFDTSSTKNSRGIQIFRILAMSLVIPAVSSAIAIACFVCVATRWWRDRHTQNVVTPPLPEQPSTTSASGLDASTIESYTKVVVGESRRVPGPNHITCPICLTDYLPKETVRCIPECQHCFHAECIDEWLRMNGTCPVCRSSPDPLPSSLTS